MSTRIERALTDGEFGPSDLIEKEEEVPLQEATEPSEDSAEPTELEELVDAEEPDEQPPAEEEATDTTDGEEVQLEEEEKWEPNLKFSVHDKEHEFDERFKDVVKTQEDEDFVRDLYTKAYGLDALKEKNSKLQERIEEEDSFKGKFEAVETNLKNLGELKQKDLAEFTRRLDITEDEIIDLAAKIVREQQDLTPEERKVKQETREQAREYERLKQEHEQLKLQREQESAHASSQTLREIIESDGIREVAQRYDALTDEHMPKFYDMFVQLGGKLEDDLERQGKPRQVDANKVAQMVADHCKRLMGEPENVVEKAPQKVKPVVATSTDDRPATLPSSPRSASSPVRKEVGGIKDLYKERERLWGKDFFLGRKD